MKSLLSLLLLLFTIKGNSQATEKLKLKAEEAKTYCSKNGLNASFCFLIDMSVHSGKNRFFIYDFKTNSISASGLVCHGLGKNSTQQQAIYSNESGSNCTSLGKYKTGKRAHSNWGIKVHYKMHGLESCNSNAYLRHIVLHSYEYVPEKEIYPSHLPLGWSQGCPVVANRLMTSIDSLLKKTKKPTLIWIFE